MLRNLYKCAAALLLGATLLIGGWLLIGSIGSVMLAQDQPAPSPTYDPTQVSVPVAPISARAGQAIYAENCAPCHGDTGQGDGPSVADLNAQPAIFADAATVWNQQPGELFHIAKFGRMQAMMPPWSNRLSDDQIWRAVAYAWSLHTSEQEVKSGAALYAEACAACHGDTGQGDGPQAEGVTSNFADPAYAIFRSQADWLAGWQAAHPEIGGEWSSNDQAATLEYMRTFVQTPPWVSPYQPGTGAISGVVVQGTAGGAAPTGNEVKLQAFLNFDPVATFTTTLAADGAFTFANLDTDPSLNYIASITPGDTSYSSDFAALSPITPTVQTTITVFETTTDATVISVERLHWIVEIEQGALLIGQIFAVSNAADRTFVGTQVQGAAMPVTFAMPLPPGAQEIAFDNGALGDRFQQVGPVIYDTLPIVPGQATRQIIMRYVLPYTGTQVDLPQELLYPSAEVSLLVADMQDLKVNATGLTFVSVEDMGGRAYQFWSGQELEPQTIGVQIENLPAPGVDDPRLAARAQAAAAAAAGTTDAVGAASTSATTSSTTATRTTPPLLASWVSGLLAGLVVAALAGALLYARATGSVRTQTTPNDLAALRTLLLERLAHLDDLHALGDVTNNDWMRQRSQLKAQLLDVEARLQGAAGAPATV